MAHGGFVIRSGKTGMNKEHNHIIEYSLKLDSNPEFTTSVLIAYARAAKRLYDEGQKLSLIHIYNTGIGNGCNNYWCT